MYRVRSVKNSQDMVACETNSLSACCSISGSSLTDVNKWVSETRKPLLPVPVPEENERPTVHVQTTTVPRVSKPPHTKRPSPALHTLPVKDLCCQAKFPLTSPSRLSLSTELLAGSMAGLLRGREAASRDHSVSGQGGMSSNTATSLSRITLPQLPFESATVLNQGLAVTGSNVSLHSVRSGVYNRRLSTRIERATPPSPVIEGTHLTPRSGQQIDVVIPSSGLPSEVRDEDSNAGDPSGQSDILVAPSSASNSAYDFDLSHPPVSPPPTARSQYTDIANDFVPVTPLPTPTSTIRSDSADVTRLFGSPQLHHQDTHTEIELSALEEQSEISTSIGDEELVEP